MDVPRIALSVPPELPLDTLPPGIPDDYGIPTLGWGVLSWSLGVPFVQPNGPRAGGPFRPTLRQVRFLTWWYALDAVGGFIFRHAVRRLAKGSGKSPFAAFLALCELCGPVRFACWDASVPGGASGAPVGMPLVQIAATSLDQTSNTMRMVRAFAASSRDGRTQLARRYRLETGKTQVIRPGVGGGDLKVITSSASGAEGGEPSTVVADETEHWHHANGGDDLFEVLDRNLAKTASRMIETCNAWEPGSGAVAEGTWEAFVAQEEGKLRGESLILYDCVEMPVAVDWSDEASLLAGLDVVYADCDWVNRRAIAERIWAPTSKPDVSRRFYGNQRVSSATSWTTPVKWGRLAAPETVLADGDEIVAFFDGSKSEDTTALLGCRVSDGHVFEVGAWEPPEGGEIDPADVDRAVLLMFDRWSVLAFFGDVKEWESYVKTSWPERHAEDLLLWSAPRSTPPAAIAWDMRAHKAEFAQAAELCCDEIEQVAFTHDGSSVLARHVGNMQRRPYQKWVSVGKESPHSPKKIDAGVCVIGVRMVRRLLLASKEWADRDVAVSSGEYWSF